MKTSSTQLIQQDEALERLAIDTIRTLAMDAVQQANSGHPGTPMALAPIAYTLWRDFIRYDPDMPDWANRDRFVLSVGHASMLLYAVLHRPGSRRSTLTASRRASPRSVSTTSGSSANSVRRPRVTPSTA